MNQNFATPVEGGHAELAAAVAGIIVPHLSSLSNNSSPRALTPQDLPYTLLTTIQEEIE
jgi:hypothetical protein